MKEIPLTQGKAALVDDADYEWLMAMGKWYAFKHRNAWYAARMEVAGNKKKPIRMHRQIVSAPANILVDHEDGNGLNNTRSNLRFATNAQNGMNRGPQVNNTNAYKGVSFGKHHKTWRAQIQINGTVKHIGTFATPEIAARAYDEAAKRYFGDFAWLNFPDSR